MRKTFLFMLPLIILALLIQISFAQCEQNVNIYFFWQDGCPHCDNEKEWLKTIEAKYPHLKVNYFRIQDNYQLFEEYRQKYNTTNAGWPRTYIGDKAYIGFSEDIGKEQYNDAYKAYIGYHNVLENAMRKELGLSEINFTPVSKGQTTLYVLAAIILLYAVSYFVWGKKHKRVFFAGLITISIISLFIAIVSTPDRSIEALASKFPFPLFVFIIAFADAFNPCAFTVLIILLSLLTYTKSKKKMLLIGGIFVITSAIMYFIFIITLLLVGSWVFAKYGLIMLRVLGTVVVVAGAINIKDFFYFKKGISLTISKENHGKIMHRARKIVQQVDAADSKKLLYLAILGTIGLGVFVNLVELGCSAILPVIYMGSLLQIFGKQIGFYHIVYTLFYCIVYVIPLFAILLNFIYTFKSDRLSESQGRILKLVGGLFMFIMGFLLLIKPELLMLG